MAERWRAQVDHYLPLIARIIDQSERRVIKGEAVPAGEKLEVQVWHEYAAGSNGALVVDCAVVRLRERGLYDGESLAYPDWHR